MGLVAVCPLLLLLSLSLLLQCHAAILRVGNPLHWVQAKPHLHTVRLSGVQQFINHYHRCKGIKMPLFYWGDEIEYGVFKKKDDAAHYDLSMNATKIREHLSQVEKTYHDLPIGCEWQPEYGSWMVEAVPKNPYGSYVSDLLNVEKSMQLRRKRLHFALQPQEIAPTISAFPMLGVEGYEHSSDKGGDVAASAYVSDRVINPHPRFGALTRNIRLRRGRNVDIRIPASIDMSSDEEEIHMDAMAFGMGCCCLQVTMQCSSEKESRFLNDQLAILSPIYQALSASTPIFRGRLAGTDTRWEVISQAVDDRRPAEYGLGSSTEIDSQRDPDLVGEGVRKLAKSRYSSVSMYIAQPNCEEESERLHHLNDLPIDHDVEVLQMMLAAGIDPVLSMHIAHLFVRDPLVIFDDAIHLDNQKSMVSSPLST
jgi:glutamate--cysteine ligase catalytic subunit